MSENQLAPLLLIDLNSTDEISHRTPHYSIVGSDFKGTACHTLKVIHYFNPFHDMNSTLQMPGLFKVEQDTGRLMVMRSLDREQKSLYNLKIKAENLAGNRPGRGHSVGKRDVEQSSSMSIHQHRHDQEEKTRARQTDSSNYHLAFDETLVIVNVGDENDNSPIFENRGKPIVAAVPLEASFGYQVAKLAVCILFNYMSS